MPSIIVTDDDGTTTRITVTGNDDAGAVIESHGFDPTVVEYEVSNPDAELENVIKDAANLSELKDALTGKNRQARVRGQGLSR